MSSCNKVPHASVRAARESVKHMGNSIRVYPCEVCGSYHVTKDRNGKPQQSASGWQERASRARRGKLSFGE